MFQNQKQNKKKKTRGSTLIDIQQVNNVFQSSN